MLKIGIECESIEQAQTWGVGREVNKILEEISYRPELKNEFKFFLYFKSKVPDFEYLNSPIFKKILIRTPFQSFSLYYYILLPIRLWFEKLDMVYFPNYMLPILFHGKSLVSLTDDVYFVSHSKEVPFRYRLAYRVFAGWAAKHATKLMTFSESSKNAVSFLFKVSKNRIFINYHGVEVKKESLQKTKIENWILKIENYILYVGQAFPRRHLRETMLAFEKIADKFRDYKLIAVGYDKYNPPIIKKLSENINARVGREIIIYKEYVPEPELIQLYAGARALTYISPKEAFGLPPIEATVYGSLPVVADAAVTREIFGENAFFVKNPDSVDEIAEVISDSMTNNDRRQKIINSASIIAKRFSWSDHTDRFLKIVREIISL